MGRVCLQRASGGRLAAKAGRRFELATMRRIRKLGLQPLRVDETDGFSHGVDVLVANRGRLLPVAIQCKASQRHRDLLDGLNEAIAGAPDMRFWACIHSLRLPGATPWIRIALQHADSPSPTIGDWSLLARALLVLAATDAPTNQVPEAVI